MSDIGKPCYAYPSGRPAYKGGGDSPIYRILPGDWTMVSFAWGSDGEDLDICAYWEGAPSMKVGYRYIEFKDEQASGAYHIFYSGDITQFDSSEWCKIKMIPWGIGQRTFRVHFNYYGRGSSATTCTVIASQMNGDTLVKRNQMCSSRHGEPALTTDPSCVLSFDAGGRLIGIS